MNEPVAHLEELDDRLQHFQNLMAQRVRNILLVASPYDSFLLEEEGGQLDEVILNEFMELNLRHAPGMTRASTGSEAVAEMRRTRYDLIISTLHIGDMPWTRLAREIKRDHPDMPRAKLVQRLFRSANNFLTTEFYAAANVCLSRQQAQQRERGLRFAGPRFANDTNRFPLIDSEADIVNDRLARIANRQPTDFQQAHDDRLASKKSRRPSPRKLKLIKMTASNVAGMSSIHDAPSI